MHYPSIIPLIIIARGITSLIINIIILTNIIAIDNYIQKREAIKKLTILVVIANLLLKDPSIPINLNAKKSALVINKFFNSYRGRLEYFLCI